MQAGHYAGSFEFCDREASIRALKVEAALPPGTRYRSNVVSIDVTYADYLTLVKHENQWQFVTKAFFEHVNA